MTMLTAGIFTDTSNMSAFARVSILLSFLLRISMFFFLSFFVSLCFFLSFFSITVWCSYEIRSSLGVGVVWAVYVPFLVCVRLNHVHQKGHTSVTHCYFDGIIIRNIRGTLFPTLVLTLKANASLAIELKALVEDNFR